MFSNFPLLCFFKIDNYIIKNNKERKDLRRFSTTWATWDSRGKESQGQMLNESMELLIRAAQTQFEAVF